MQKGILTLILCLIIVFSLHAQNAETITLQEAIDIALKNNYQLRQAENNVDLAEATLLGAKADFLPTLNGRFNGGQTQGQQFNSTTVRFEDVTTSSVSGGLNTNIAIFQGFRNILNLRSNRANENLQKENLERTRQTVIFNVASGFLQVILNEQLLKIAEENLESSQKQLEQVRAQVEVGSRPTVDLYNQESTVANNELEVIRRENTLNFSRVQLVSIIQLDPTREYEFDIPGIDEFAPNPSDIELSNLIEKALANRSDLQAQQLLIKRNEYDLGIARSNYYPTVTANAGINTNYNDQYRIRTFNPADSSLVTGKVGFYDQFFDQLVNKSIGFSVSIPIFNNLNSRINVQSAQINYKNSRLQLESVRFAIYEEVRQAYNDYQSYAKQLESSSKALEAARRTYETQRERYNVGAGTLIELSNANAQFVQAQADRAQAVFRFIFQQKLLDYYIGRLDPNISLN